MKGDTAASEGSYRISAVSSEATDRQRRKDRSSRNASIVLFLIFSAITCTMYSCGFFGGADTGTVLAVLSLISAAFYGSLAIRYHALSSVF